MRSVSKKIFLVFFFGSMLVFPKETQAIGIFSPFSGKVALWSPTAPGCAPITAAVCVATLGSVCPTIEELVVAPPNGGTFGILRVDGVPVPGLTTIYRNYAYQAPGTLVIGKSINICGICKNISDIPGIKSITKALCDIPAVSKIVDTVCQSAGGVCPVGNLIYKMGTSGTPSL